MFDFYSKGQWFEPSFYLFYFVKFIIVLLLDLFGFYVYSFIFINILIFNDNFKNAQICANVP